MTRFTGLSLRLRGLLFFALLAVGSIVVVGLALWVGYLRVAASGAMSGFVFAAVLAGFGLVALTSGIWFLFDENVARPIERLASGLRTQGQVGSTPMPRAIWAFWPRPPRRCRNS